MATRKSAKKRWYGCLPACVSWVVTNFLARNISIFGFQKVFKGTEKQRGFFQRITGQKETQKPAAQADAQHSQTAQHHKAAQHDRTQHRRRTPQDASPAHQTTGQAARCQARTQGPTHTTERKQEHPQQRRTHRTAQQHSTARQHGTKEHSTRQHDTTTHHTKQQGRTTTPQSVKGDSTAHSDTPQHKAPTSAQTKRAPKNTTHSATQHRRHRKKTQTNTTSKAKRTAGHPSAAPHGNTAPQNTGHSTGGRGATTNHSTQQSSKPRSQAGAPATKHASKKNNSGQPDPATNTQQPQATTHGTSQRNRSNRAPPAQNDADSSTPIDRRHNRTTQHRTPGQNTTTGHERGPGSGNRGQQH